MGIISDIYNKAVDITAWAIDPLIPDSAFDDPNSLANKLADAGQGIQDAFNNGNIAEGFGKTYKSLLDSGVHIGKDFGQAMLDVDFSNPMDLLKVLGGGLGGFLVGNSMGGTFVGIVGALAGTYLVPKIADHFTKSSTETDVVTPERIMPLNTNIENINTVPAPAMAPSM